MQANNATAFGSGDLTLNGGTLSANVNGGTITNNYSVNGATNLTGIAPYILSGTGVLNALLTNITPNIVTISGDIS